MKGNKGTVIHTDGAHAAHANTKRHSGPFVTQGKGAVSNASKKAGVAATSLTETGKAKRQTIASGTAWFGT